MNEDTSYKAHQARTALSRYLLRRARYLLGAVFPDPRDQELQDRGLELDWRARVIRRRGIAAVVSS